MTLKLSLECRYLMEEQACGQDDKTCEHRNRLPIKVRVLAV
jgi:hypothetical protein